MNQTTIHVDGHTIHLKRARLRDMGLYDASNNPWLWWAWEYADGERYDFACGVATRRAALDAVEYETGLSMAVAR